jgi:quercetin dioxygenase-like cupin family protein
MWSGNCVAFTVSGVAAFDGRLRLGCKRVAIAAMMTTGVAAAPAPAYSSPSETLVPLLRQAIPTIPGKTLTAVNVVFPPGARSVPHRHGDAFLYAYVLEGEVRSQIEGQPVRVYKIGDSWSEKPGDHHVLTENVSSNATARLLVVFIADANAALKTDDDPTKAP